MPSLRPITLLFASLFWVNTGPLVGLSVCFPLLPLLLGLVLSFTPSKPISTQPTLKATFLFAAPTSVLSSFANFLFLTQIVHKSRILWRVSGKASGRWKSLARLSIFSGGLVQIRCLLKKISWSEKSFKNRVVLVVRVVRILLCTHYGAVPTSKWFGIRISIGWINAQLILSPFRTFCKKSEPNLLYYLYLLLRPGQSGIKETNLAIRTIPCPFTILPVLQKLSLRIQGSGQSTSSQTSGYFSQMVSSSNWFGEDKLWWCLVQGVG